MAEAIEPGFQKKRNDSKCVKCNKFIRKTYGVSIMIETPQQALDFNKEFNLTVPVGGVICSNCRKVLRTKKSKENQTVGCDSKTSHSSSGMTDKISCISNSTQQACKELLTGTSKQVPFFDVPDDIFDDDYEPVTKKAKDVTNAKCASCDEFLRKTQGNSKSINTREEAMLLYQKCEFYIQIGEVLCQKCYTGLRFIKRKKEQMEMNQNDEMSVLENDMSQISVEKSSYNDDDDLLSGTHSSASINSQLQNESQNTSCQQNNASQSLITSSQTSNSNNSDSTYYDSEQEPNETLEMPFPRTNISHAYCFICGERDAKNIRDVPVSARLQVFVQVRIFIPRRNRCCEKHLIKNQFYSDELRNISIFSNVCSMEVQEVKMFLDTLSDEADVTLLNKIGGQILSEERIKALTGYTWDNIRQLEKMMKNVRDSSNRNILQALVIFLIKLRTGNSNNCISAILETEESVVENSIKTVLTCFEKEILSKNFGIDAFDRDFFISQSSAVAQKLYNLENRLALICDGTYLRHQKSSNNAYQRKSYSGQKKTPLCKPFTIATTNGFVVELAGPFLGTINDAQILKMILNDAQGLSKMLKPGDIFILDRGFRDVVPFLESQGYEVYMPALKGKQNQLTVEQSNESRLVTKVRWVVEAVHGIIGQKCKLLHNQFNNNSLPHAKTYCKIACLLYNLFCKRLNSDDGRIDEIIARINDTKQIKNTLAVEVEEKNWNRKTVPFSKASSRDLLDFPEMTIADLQLFFTGTYQLSQAISYLAEMLQDNDNLNLNYFKDKPNILRFEVRSRHINKKTYKCYVQYKPNSVGINGIERYCCNCANGNRTVGCCSHVAAVIYYLSYARYLSVLIRPAQQLEKLFEHEQVYPIIDDDSDED